MASQNNPPILNAPSAVRWIVGITTLIHLIRFLMPGSMGDGLLELLAFVPGRYDAPGGDGLNTIAMVISPVGHMFLHADWMHLIINMAFLLAFGSAIGRRMGASQFVIFYLICGIAACFIWEFMNAASQAILVGASGAVSGMVGGAARVSIWPPRHSRSALPFWRRSTVITFVVVWLLMNVVFGIFPFLITDAYAGIAWEAHLGGFIVGFLIIGAFDGRGRIEPMAVPATYH